MRLLAIIPARGGSKGIPGKNLREVAGHPLIYWTITAARAASCIDRVIVSADDQAIADYSIQAGAEVPFLRPVQLAQDDSPTLPVLQHVTAMLAENENYKADAVMTLQPTSPLRTAQHIHEASEIFEQDPEADSLVSCIRVPHIFHPLSVMRKDANGYLVPYLEGDAPLRRQDKEEVVARNGAAIYITRNERLSEFIFGGKLIPYYMSSIESLDVDTEEDLLLADKWLREKHG